MTEANSSFTRPGFTDDAALDLQYLRALAGASYGAASPGEVLVVADTVRRRGGDRDAYIQAWAEQGRRVAMHGAEAIATGRRATALSAYLRAYNYLRAAEFFVPASRLEERRKLYEESVAQFDAAVPLMPHPAEKIAIPYANGVMLPGYVFTVADDGRPRPTVVACGGVDGYGEEMYLLAGVPDALARGLNVVAFHGPGQRGLQLYHPELAFQPDAEVPLGAVMDYAADHPDVDGDRIALYGMSFGGYLAPRAAAHDKRVKALVANAPQRDLLGIVLGAGERNDDNLMKEVKETRWGGVGLRRELPPVEHRRGHTRGIRRPGRALHPGRPGAGDRLPDAESRRRRRNRGGGGTSPAVPRHPARTQAVHHPRHRRRCGRPLRHRQSPPHLGIDL
ncbi:prolyl oligopeptidase family serine peptidase [Spirillospora sp. NPDC047279]|uniref:alpha/beta hydrolase family protein n=1 Tax=Spirillospora sp. NPDC047279 TaxID=3155478 RepID=UPI0033F965F3